jgi:hypothetical protein
MERDILAATADVAEPGGSQLRDTFALYTWYVRGFKACARACFAVRFHRQRASAATRDAAGAEIDALVAYRDALARRLAGTRYAYMTYWMLDVARLDSLIADLRALLG